MIPNNGRVEPIPIVDDECSAVLDCCQLQCCLVVSFAPGLFLVVDHIKDSLDCINGFDTSNFDLNWEFLDEVAPILEVWLYLYLYFSVDPPYLCLLIDELHKKQLLEGCR